MSDNATEPEEPLAQESTGPESTDDPQVESDSDVEVGSPDYPSFGDESATTGQAGDLARLQNIKIAVSAELGRTQIPIQELMELAEGSVVELDRAIDSPIDLIAQGVTLASGEVVVIDGCFAIRILSVHANN